MKKLCLIVALTILFPLLAAAQGNAFNFQGRLNDGTSPANGQYDLQFRLYDAAAGGNQIGPQVLRPRTTLINGVFSVALDFGAAAFANPNSIFIEIAVKPNGSPNAFTILGPRQQLTVVPYASRSQNATNSDNAQNAVNAQNAANATTAQNSLSLGGLASNLYALKSDNTNFIRNSTTTQPDSKFNISGSGIVGGDLSIGGNQSLVGNQAIGGRVTQARDKYGAPKAMIYLSQSGFINRCYNGVTGASTGNCGFTATSLPTLIGVYRIDFGFQVNDRFVFATAEYNSAPLQNQPNNWGVNYRFFGTTALDIFMFAGDEAEDTADATSMIIVF